MNQNETVLFHMMHIGPITQHIADEYGITRLASRICDIKKMGINVYSSYITAPTRYGRGLTHVKEYHLAEGVKNADDEQKCRC